MDDFGQFLFLLAFVIIAAIQWVIKQIQERNAPPEREDDPPEESWGDDYQQNKGFEAEEAQRPAAANPLSELRQLFESLKRQQEAPVEPAPPQQRYVEVPVVVAPPPQIPMPEKRVFKDPRKGLSAAEREALKRVEERKAASYPSKRKGPNDGGFRKFLHGAGNLRQALILKEVFDRPIALRHESMEESISG